jgi:hypothetical protein
MKILFWVGLVVLVLGIVSLFVAIPQKERHGVEIGGASVGVEVKNDQKVSPIISAILIAGGAGMMIAAGTSRRRSA